MAARKIIIIEASLLNNANSTLLAREVARNRRQQRPTVRSLSSRPV